MFVTNDDGTVSSFENTATIFKNRDALGAYTYLEGRLSRRYHPGLLLEYVQDLDRTGNATWAVSPYFTFWASEFQRLRVQYTHIQNTGPKRVDDQFFLQWTVVMGSHVHGFRDR
jgi:hypothetical protein